MKNLREEIDVLVDVYKKGNLLESEEIAKKLINKNPKIGFLYNLLGLTLVGQKRPHEAEKIYQKGIEADPSFAMTYNNLGLIYYSSKNSEKDILNNFKKAEDLFKKSISLDEKIAEPKTNLGNLYHATSRFDESIKFHKMAIETNPNIYFAYLNLSNVYIALGNFKEAEKNLRKSISIKPDFILAHRLLSRIIKYTKQEPHLKQLIVLYNNLKNNNENKMLLSFSLGKAHEDIKDFNKSFYFYQTANSIHRKKINFSIKEEKEKFDEIKKTYTKDLLNIFSNKGCDDPNKIFIVGMPRSGTTLVEQILASHSDVFGADEVELIPDIVKKFFGSTGINLFLQGVFNFDKNILKKMGENYIYEMNNKSNSAKRSTDKLPYNFLNIGLIHLILPKSKIIHCYRNPKDNIFSIYKNFFPGNKITFSSDLNETVGYYNLYRDLIKFWKNILPNFIYDISYENLINNTESETKMLLKYCNLSWDKNCLSFYNNKRPVKTASDTQVRNKIYKTSIDSWKNYQDHLNKFYDNL